MVMLNCAGQLGMLDMFVFFFFFGNIDDNWMLQCDIIQFCKR